LKSLLLSLNVQNKCIIQLECESKIICKIELPQSGNLTLEWDSFENVPKSLCTLELKCECLEDGEKRETQLLGFEIEMSSR
jgi:hypothetical protein